MVGAAYAIERNFFKEMGKYDEGMKVWGGENLEMAWRVLHVIFKLHFRIFMFEFSLNIYLYLS